MPVTYICVKHYKAYLDINNNRYNKLYLPYFLLVQSYLCLEAALLLPKQHNLLKQNNIIFM